MPEEALKEVAATNEPPNRLASPEFFFLLQRIDRLDEKLSREIKEVEVRLDAKLDTLRFWTIGAVITLIAGFAGVIIALLQR
ncbi:MAG: hypothetical protein IMW96_11450 [Thermoanaerobacteraceae bacterium]|nr:hypothetical protein [Thermoanaerobacteraceae bacterium]